MSFQKRLLKEIKEIQNENQDLISIQLSDENKIDNLTAKLQGPSNTAYENIKFTLSITISDRYPFEPPGIKFVTPVYHPNIDKDGRICLDLLKLPPQGSWKPVFNLLYILQALRMLLEEPNPNDPLDVDIANEFLHNRDAFKKKAKRLSGDYRSQINDEKDMDLDKQNELEKNNEAEKSNESKENKEEENINELEKNADFEKSTESELSKALEKNRQSDKKRELKKLKESKKSNGLEKSKIEKSKESKKSNGLEMNKTLEKRKESKKSEKLKENREPKKSEELKIIIDAEKSKEMTKNRELQKNKELERKESNKQENRIDNERNTFFEPPLAFQGITRKRKQILDII